MHWHMMVWAAIQKKVTRLALTGVTVLSATQYKDGDPPTV
jgi:hypothetical protein